MHIYITYYDTEAIQNPHFVYAPFSSLPASTKPAKNATQLHHTASIMAATIEPVPEWYHPRVQDKYH